MAITFPSSPTVGQTYTVGNKIFTWNGTDWILSAAGVTGTAGALYQTSAPTAPSAAVTAGTIWVNPMATTIGTGTAISTDALLGSNVYVGSTTPTSPAAGDVWIDYTSSTNPLTTKGDILAYSPTGATKRSVGSDGAVLMADSAQNSGLNWGGPLTSAGKNKIINGDMNIDQRFSGAASSATSYTVDRWTCFRTSTNGGTFTTQQVADAPSGFTYSLKASNVTNSTASTVWIYQQYVEGYNVQSFNLGSASASTFTLSFWVKSTTVGTYSGHFSNGVSGSPRTYVFTYTINSANTWEKKTITAVGDTSGTWYKDNRTGIKVLFNIGTGGTEGPLNAWSSADNVRASGAVGLDNISSSSWQITGVQLELGSMATPFSTATGTIQGELAACQRYYQRLSGTSIQIVTGMAEATTDVIFPIPSAVQMRATPTSIEYSAPIVYNGVTTYSGGTMFLRYASPYVLGCLYRHGSGVFTAGSTWILYSGTNAYYGFSAEL